MTNIEYVKKVVGSYKDLEDLADAIYKKLQNNEVVADTEIYEAADSAYSLYDLPDSVSTSDFIWGDSEWVESILQEIEAMVEDY